MALSEAQIRQMHKDNQTAIEKVCEEVDDVMGLLLGKKDDPDDTGMKGDIIDLKRTMKWLLRIAIAAFAFAIVRSVPDTINLLKLVFAGG